MGRYRAKMPNEKGIIDFTAEENATWECLIERQIQVIQNRACDEFILGLNKLNFPYDRIPQCSEVSTVLKQETGWEVTPVPAIIPLDKFFSLLANRQFPAATFIRTQKDLDYLQEPDIFHEFFGHCPLLTNQAYADFIQRYAMLALQTDTATQGILGRLFWFTIEFGLLKTPKGLRIYGGGILSSFQETIYALEDSKPSRLPFSLQNILTMSYQYDAIQERYYILDKLDDLYDLNMEGIKHLAYAIASGHYQQNSFITC